MDRVSQLDRRTEEDIKYRYYDVIQLYRKSFVQDNAQRLIEIPIYQYLSLSMITFAIFYCHRSLALAP